MSVAVRVPAPAVPALDAAPVVVPVAVAEFDVLTTTLAPTATSVLVADAWL
jgi:hypothetical protein